MTKLDIELLDFEKAGGLIPAIIQDDDSNAVLMLGYMNREAVERTLATGRVTFFSRSRNEIWVKGETSGNWLELTAITADCDRDCVLVRARPAGPVCHTGTQTCFGAEQAGIIAELEAIIDHRADASGSYVARLKADGISRMAQKVGEEGVETALALTGGDAESVKQEAADLVFHLLVGLNARGLEFADVLQELSRRREASSAK